MLDLELLAALPFVLRVEVEENVTRKDFSQSELAEIQRAVIEHLTAARKVNQGRRTDLTSTKNFVEVGQPGRADNTTALVAKMFGESEPTTRKRLAIVDAAKADPNRFTKLVADMDRTRRVNGVWRRLSNTLQADRIRAEPPPLPTGPFRVIAVDWPSAYEVRSEDPSQRGALPYPTMSLKQICALPVAKLAHADCALWFWTNNLLLANGTTAHVHDAWGFAPKTILTWDKVHFINGDWLRGQTEHCVLATRGSPNVDGSSTPTLLREPRKGAHSEKPNGFYALVKRICPAPPGGYCELFARQQRPGWVTWGDEVAAGGNAALSRNEELSHRRVASGKLTARSNLRRKASSPEQTSDPAVGRPHRQGEPK